MIVVVALETVAVSFSVDSALHVCFMLRHIPYQPYTVLMHEEVLLYKWLHVCHSERSGLHWCTTGCNAWKIR